MAHVLPELPFEATPNESQRLHGARPHLIVVHTWGNPPASSPAEAESRFEGNVSFMRDPGSQVSAHVVYGGQLVPEGKRRAVQLVEWQRKAWTQAGANSFSYSIESADAIWLPAPDWRETRDEAGLRQLARIVGYISLHSRIPAAWAKTVGMRGIARHRDLGPVGNPSGHVDPTGNVQLWLRFLHLVQDELERGGYRPTWGHGTWVA